MEGGLLQILTEIPSEQYSQMQRKNEVLLAENERWYIYRVPISFGAQFLSFSSTT